MEVTNLIFTTNISLVPEHYVFTSIWSSPWVVIVVLLIIVIVIQMLLIYQVNIEQNEEHAEAVRRGFAYWLVDDTDGTTRFTWKDQDQKPHKEL